jgi:hypothetical protein
VTSPPPAELVEPGTGSNLTHQARRAPVHSAPRASGSTGAASAARAARIHRSTSAEFGVSQGSPGPAPGPSQLQAPASSGSGSGPPPTPTSRLPEFDP